MLCGDGGAPFWEKTGGRWGGGWGLPSPTPYINIDTPWPCEPLNLCRLIMSWKLDARFMHNHRRKIHLPAGTKDPFPWRQILTVSLYRVCSLMVVECQQLAYLVTWSPGLWYCGHLENMRSHYEHLITPYSGLLWFEFSELKRQTGWTCSNVCSRWHGSCLLYFECFSYFWSILSESVCYYRFFWINSSVSGLDMTSGLTMACVNSRMKHYVFGVWIWSKCTVYMCV